MSAVSVPGAAPPILPSSTPVVPAQSKREFKIWDEKNTAKPIATYELDQAAGVMIPFYDEDTRMLYLTGKVRTQSGQGGVRSGADAAPLQAWCDPAQHSCPALVVAVVLVVRCLLSPRPLCPLAHCRLLLSQGDGNIRYFELVDEEPFVYFLTEHRTNVSTKVRRRPPPSNAVRRAQEWVMMFGGRCTLGARCARALGSAMPLAQAKPGSS